jgi:hypothetical protein
MSHSARLDSDKTRKPPPIRRRRFALNILIGVLAVLVVFLSYELLRRTMFRPPVDQERTGPGPGSIIQLEVLNGCGAQGAAVAFTQYLRARGYDVVEVRNYKNFDVKESLVIDRTGERENAVKIAYALGITKENIIQQLNPEYYIDVSVVIGRDYTSLKPSQ